MRARITIDIPAGVDVETYAALERAATLQEGVTIITSRGVEIDVDLHRIEEVQVSRS